MGARLGGWKMFKRDGLLHIATMTVNTRRKKALSALREILEGLQYGA